MTFDRVVERHDDDSVNILLAKGWVLISISQRGPLPVFELGLPLRPSSPETSVIPAELSSAEVPLHASSQPQNRELGLPAK